MIRMIWGQQAPGVLLDGASGPGERAGRSEIRVGQVPGMDVVVSGAARVGGHLCFELEARGDAVVLVHAGHALAVRRDGVDVPACESVELAHGDRIEPAAAGGGDGPRFVFVAPTGPRRPSPAGAALVGTGGRHPIDPGRALVIGGSPHADLVVDGPGSPMVRLRGVDGAWWIDPLDHGAGATVAGAPVPRAGSAIRYGDELVWPTGARWTLVA